ncbi:MAG: glycosyl hydrolase family 28-related protein [Myxococcales bacterium]|nr:glycosyl hydrolase family 28-related protein [Myxococcales bacterium]MDD9970935.1 glycosyl hydrolase family 28-related protein [Myxococcales bacterium]
MDAKREQRRGFLKRAGLGATGLALSGCAYESQASTPEANAAGVGGSAFALSAGGGHIADTYDDVRGLAVPPPSSEEDIAVFVRGRSTVGDGGAGTFFWDPDASLGDNDGTVLKPVEYSGSGAWKRAYSGPLDVRWFGAGAGAADDAPAIQSAIAAAVALTQNASGHVFSTYSRPTVYLPSGVYPLASTVELHRYVSLEGETGATLRAVNNEVVLLRVAGVHNTIDGVSFVHGRNSIALYGPLAEGGGTWNPDVGTQPLFIRNCHFHYPRGPAIWQDVLGGNRSFQSALVVEQFSFIGPHLYWGAGDAVIFKNGRVSWDLANLAQVGEPGHQTVEVPSGEVLPLACFNTNVNLIVDSCFLYPVGGGAGATWPSRAAWFAGTGNIRIIECSTSDMIDQVFVRQYVAATAYLDSPVPTGPNPKLVFVSERSPMDCAGGTNWLEVYDDFPKLIAVHDRWEINFETSWGIWVHDDIDMYTVLKEHAYLHGIFLGRYKHAGAYRIRQSSDPTNREGFDLRSYLHIFQQEPQEHLDPGPQDNLFLPGVYNAFQPPQMSAGGGPMLQGDHTDSGTGYQLQGWTAAAAPNHFTMTSAPWGVTDDGYYPPGLYVFAFYFKVNFDGAMSIGYRCDGSWVNAKTHTFAGRDTYQRASFSFYFPADTTFQLGAAIYSFPLNGTISAGLFSVHRGTTPSPYVFPGNPAMESNAVQQVSFLGGPPTTGTWRKGDIVYNSDPKPNDFVGWVFTDTGWKPFGAIQEP